jgi:peptide/nickel transport system permease protein
MLAGHAVGPWQQNQVARRLASIYAHAKRYPWVPLCLMLLLLVIPALFAPLIAPYDPIEGRLSQRLLPPAWLAGGSWDHLLGTDKQGRDILTRIIYGARISLSVSLVSIALAGSLGTVMGLAAGYFGGWLDAVVMRIVDAFLSMPLVLVALVAVAVFGPSFLTVIGVVTAVLWTSYARQVRAEALSIKQMDFVARARVVGASDLRIMFRHILPNVVNTIIVIATLEMGSVILLEATLSFLGAGIPRPDPSWGVMVADGRDQITAAWWMSFFPGFALMMVVLSANVLGDWLRDHLDPKLRQV